MSERVYLAEALLAGHQRIAVMSVFHGANLRVRRRADVVVRPEDQAGPFPGEKSLDRLDLRPAGLLLVHEVVESEHHERVGIVEDALVERRRLTCLIHALVDRDGMSSNLLDHLLEPDEGEVEELQRPGDALEKHLPGELRRLVGGPGHPADLRHRGEAIVHLRDVAVGLPRVAPAPVDAHAPLARGVLPRHVHLVVRPRTRGLGHESLLQRRAEPGAPAARKRSARMPGRKK